MPSVAALKSLLKIRNSLGDNKHIGTNLLFFAFFLRAIFFKEIKDGLLLSRKENNNLFYWYLSTLWPFRLLAFLTSRAAIWIYFIHSVSDLGLEAEGGVVSLSLF